MEYKTSRSPTITFQAFTIAEMIRTTVDSYTNSIPSVLEIPSKEHPYDPDKDSIFRRARTDIQMATSKLVAVGKFIGRSTLSILRVTKSVCVWTAKRWPRRGHVLSLPPALIRECQSPLPISTTTLVRTLSEEIKEELRSQFLKMSDGLRFAVNNKLAPLRTELKKLDIDGEESDKIFVLTKHLDEVIRLASFGEVNHKELPNLLSGYDSDHGLQIKFYSGDYTLLRIWLSSLGNRVILAYKLRGKTPLIIRFYRSVTAFHKLLPCGRICFSGSDKIIFYPTLCVSVISASALFYYWPQSALGLSVVTLANLVLALSIRLLYNRRRLRFLSSLVSIQHQLALSSQQPLISELTSLAEQEIFKQCLLTFYLLHSNSLGLKKEEINTKAKEKFNSDVPFDSSKALSLLTSLGVISVENGVYKSASLSAALSTLPDVPINFFPDEVDWLENDEKMRKIQTFSFWR